MWTNITSVITHLVSLMGNMTTSLFGNELFQMILGLIFFSIGLGMIFSIVKQIIFGANKPYDREDIILNKMEKRKIKEDKKYNKLVKEWKKNPYKRKWRKYYR